MFMHLNSPWFKPWAMRLKHDDILNEFIHFPLQYYIPLQ